MAVAIAATLALPKFEGGDNFAKFFVPLAAGAAAGTVLALRVEMMEMPELVALLHSFVGVAATLVGLANYLSKSSHSDVVELIESACSYFLLMGF